jgi:hypothetical protein
MKGETAIGVAPQVRQHRGIDQMAVEQTRRQRINRFGALTFERTAPNAS